MAWFRPKAEKPLREQLLDARETLVRQISVLDTGPIKFEPGATDYMADQAADLRQTLSQINDELVRIEGDKG